MVSAEKSMREYLIEEYGQSLAEAEDTAKAMETPVDIAKREKEEELFSDAEELLRLNILNDEYSKDYIELGNRISAKTAEIEKLYGIEINEYSLQAIRAASERIKGQYGEELLKDEREFSSKMDAIAEETELKSSEMAKECKESLLKLEAQIKELQESSTREFEREQKEYDYNLKRERKNAMEKRASEVREREQQLKCMELDAKEQKTTNLKRLSEINAMKAEVEGIPEQLDKAGEDGALEREKELNREHQFKTELEKKTQEHKVNELQEEYDRLLQKYEALKAETTEISRRLEQCNLESRKLTGETVRYIGGINILNSDTHTHGENTIKK